jgi:hypothetical protein
MKNKHFIALVPMDGQLKGLIGQHSTEQPTKQAAEKWAENRFSRPAVIVDMSEHDNANSLPTDIALKLYKKGIIKPFHVLRITVTQEETPQVHIVSDYRLESISIPFNNEPGAIKPALETAVKYLQELEFNIIGVCNGKPDQYDYVISDTFTSIYK